MRIISGKSRICCEHQRKEKKYGSRIEYNRDRELLKNGQYEY